MTGYVSTRFYRAPEIMLTWQKYDFAGKQKPMRWHKSRFMESWLHHGRIDRHQAAFPWQRPFVYSLCSPARRRPISHHHGLAWYTGKIGHALHRQWECKLLVNRFNLRTIDTSICGIFAIEGAAKFLTAISSRFCCRWASWVVCVQCVCSIGLARENVGFWSKEADNGAWGFAEHFRSKTF